MSTVILGLGTNMGNREEHLRRAVAALRPLLADMRCSAVYQSSALLPEGAPKEWNTPFLNMALCGDTELQPLMLLAETQAVEQALGRKARGHWGPREIDIDILAYDDKRVALPTLAIPHRELLKRDFALIPLAGLAPDWIHPETGKTAFELAARMKSTLTKTDIIVI